MQTSIPQTPLTKPLATYTHTRQIGDLVFVAGQGCRDPKTNEYRGITRGPNAEVLKYDLHEQAKGVLDNISKALSMHKLDKSDIADVTVFLKSKNDFSAMNEVWNDFFKGVPAPTRTTVFITDLPGDNFVEMKAIAKTRN
jgi:enamine deaminase RidA (YjgF/YER057c/UK114 family)